MSTFVVTAYRWGWTNNSWYPVYAGPDKTKAIALAGNECADRGGKYGVQVVDTGDDGTAWQPLAYFPSTYGEKRPYHNERIQMFSNIGHRAAEAADGTIYVQDESERHGILKPVAIEPPDWLKEIVRKEEEMCEAIQAIHDKRNPPNIPQEPTDAT